jgi:hypothetical protein
MKIRIEHTIELSDWELKAMKSYFSEFDDGSETFREFIKSYVLSGGLGILQDKTMEYRFEEDQ